MLVKMLLFFVQESTFSNTELDSLTHEYLLIICCTCLLLVKNQLQDQLPGGKYSTSSQYVMRETNNCLRKNILSEKDFVRFDDAKMKLKP